MPPRTAPVSGALRKADVTVVRDPWTVAALLIGAFAALFAGARAGLLPVLVALFVGYLLMRPGRLTDARLFSIAFAARSLCVVAMAMVGGRGKALFPDEADSVLIAGSLLDRWQGHPAAFDVPAFAKSGAGYLFTPFVAVGGREVTSVRLASALAASLGVVALWRLGRYMFGAKAARRAALALALFPSAILWTSSGLKEGFVLLAVVLAIGCGVVAASAPSLRRAVLWCLPFAVSLLVLAALREALAFVAAVVITGVALFAVISATRRHSISPPRALLRAGAVALAAGIALWCAGYGVMGVEAFKSLNPGYLNKVHDLGVEDGTGIGGGTGTGGRVEATSEVPPASQAGDQLSRLANRLPTGAIAILARPWPWEAPAGALGQHASIAPLVIIPDQILWYMALIASVIGAFRALRRFPLRSFAPLAFTGATVFFYSLTQANVGTAYRQRTALLPFILLAAFVAAHPRSRSDAKRAALVVPTLGEGGTERHVLRVGEGLVAAGREVVLAPLRSGRHRESAGEAGIAISELKRRGRFDLGLPLRAAKLLGRGRIWSTYLFAGNFWGGLGARRAGAPHLSNIRTSHPRGFVARLLEPLVAGEIVLVNSQAVARGAARRGFDPVRIRILCNGIDPSQLRSAADESGAGIRDRLGLRADDFVITVPGRVDPLKDQLTAVKAFELADLTDALLCLAGPAELAAEKAYKAELENITAHLGERVRLLGQVDEMAGLLAASDLVMLTSAHEGMPTAVLEAMALGRPVVATRAGGTPEVVLDGRTGILCDVGDAAGLAEAIKKLHSERELAEAMGAAARERIDREFTADSELAGLESALDECAAIAAADDRPLDLSGGGGARVGMKEEDIASYAAYEFEQAAAGEYDELLRRIPVELEGATVIDLAAGPGTWSRLFDEAGAALTVWHDRSDEFLLLATDHLSGRGRVKFTLADLAAFPYRDNMADLVFCRVSLHHSPDEAETISEVARVLREGGVAALVTNRMGRVSRRVPLGWKKPFHYLTPAVAAATGRRPAPSLWNIDWLLKSRLRRAGLEIETWDSSDPESLVVFARKARRRTGRNNNQGPLGIENGTEGG